MNLRLLNFSFFLCCKINRSFTSTYLYAALRFWLCTILFVAESKTNRVESNLILYLFFTRHLISLLPLVSQAASLRQLEEENQEAAARLEEVVYRGDMLLEKIQSALADIAQSQLRTRSGAPSQPTPQES